MKVVAVFGGGGAKSIACVGAWKALVEAGLTPSHLVGTSMGAVIAAAFASGATYDEVVIAGRSLSQRDVARVDPLALVKGAFATHLLKPADLVIAIHVGPGFDEPAPRPSTGFPPALVRAHGEAIRIMMAAQVDRLIADWPRDAARLLVVRPVAEREATFAVGAAERYLQAGYDAARRWFLARSLFPRRSWAPAALPTPRGRCLFAPRAARAGPGGAKPKIAVTPA